MFFWQQEQDRRQTAEAIHRISEGNGPPPRMHNALLNACFQINSTTAVSKWHTMPPLGRESLTLIGLDPLNKMREIEVMKEETVKLEQEMSEERHQPNQDNSNPSSDMNIACSTCGSTEEEDIVLLCDSCNARYYTYCVRLKKNVPDGSWFCPRCLEDRGVATQQFATKTPRGPKKGSCGKKQGGRQKKGSPGWPNRDLCQTGLEKTNRIGRPRKLLLINKRNPSNGGTTFVEPDCHA